MYFLKQAKHQLINVNLMNKKIKKIFLYSLSLITYLGLFSVVFAEGGGTDYVLLEPLPGISSVPVGGFGAYLSAMFKLSIGLATVLAVLQLSVAGFKYLIQDSFSTKSDARETINNALIGLLLILSSYLILKTINPDLVSQDLMIPPVGGFVTEQETAKKEIYYTLSIPTMEGTPCTGNYKDQDGDQYNLAGKDSNYCYYSLK